MNKKLSILSVLFLVLVLLFSFSVRTFASVTPTLSLAGTGDGDSVQINVTGDPSTSVLFIYTKSGIGQQIGTLGNTDANGNFSTTVSSSSYGIPAGSMVHVVMGNINGLQSSNVAWPTVSSTISNTNMLSLSQTGLVMSIGQSASITASNVNSSSLYLSNNSNPVIANFSVSGSQITVLANSYGSTTGTVCLINNTSNCGSIYVIVQNSNAQPLTFSQNTVSISSGQTIAIQISGGSGSYSVLNNSSQNNGLVQTSISGGTITLTTNSTTGSSSITVCSTGMTSCGIINVTIGNTNTSAVSFSQSNPTVTVAQSLNISIFGPSNSLFYVASNSNPSVVQANLSGSTLTLLGITNGSSTISICASSNNCASLTVTVNSNSNTSGRLMLSQENITLSLGQTGNITISGGAMPYNVVAGSNSNVVQSSLNGNILTLVGLNNGSSLLNVCSTAGGCVTLSVTVSANGQNNGIVNLPVGCSSTAGYSQTTGLPCGSSSNTNTYVPADCNGAIYSISTGLACPASTVNTSSSNNTVAPDTSTDTSTTPAKTTFKFTKSIKLGSKGTEVSQLQTKLKTLGFYKGKIDGGFGATTEKAVKAFQKSHKLPQVGNVGPKTRALLNK
jgi:hypothetical protein